MKTLLALFTCAFLMTGALTSQQLLTSNGTADATYMVKNNKKKKGNNRKPKKPVEVDARVQKRTEMITKADDQKMADLVRAGQAATGNRGGIYNAQAAAANQALEQMRKRGTGFDIPKVKAPVKKSGAAAKKRK